MEPNALKLNAWNPNARPGAARIDGSGSIWKLGILTKGIVCMFGFTVGVFAMFAMLYWKEGGLRRCMFASRIHFLLNYPLPTFRSFSFFCKLERVRANVYTNNRVLCTDPMCKYSTTKPLPLRSSVG